MTDLKELLAKQQPTTTESSNELRKKKAMFNSLAQDIRNAARDLNVTPEAEKLLAQAIMEVNGLVDVPEVDAAKTWWRVLGETPEIIAELRALAETMPGNNPNIVYDSWYPQLVRWLTPNRNGHVRPMIELVGPAGSGKSFMARIALVELGYTVYEVDCTEFMTPFDLVGRPRLTSDESGNPTEMFAAEVILRALTDPDGALLLNEFDALNPKVQLLFQGLFQRPNADGTGRYLTLPQSIGDLRSVIPAGRLPFLATSNTYGSGASRHYIRNRADGANIDRRSVIETTYENEAEKLQWHGFSQKTSTELVKWAVNTRLDIDGKELPVILSTRALLNAAEDIEEHRISFDRALEDNFWGKLDPRVRQELKS